MKLITPGVADLIKASYESTFPGGNFLGDVALAPFHDFDDQISQEIKDKIEEAKAGLEDGSLETGFPVEE
jgi:basic membrane protein A